MHRLFIIALVYFLIACNSQNQELVLKVPTTFDSLPPIPAENQLTPKRVELGELLFHETALSADGLISCSSCHKREFAYADTARVSAGVHGKLDNRNSPSLINVAYQKRLFREGGIPNLEIQVLAPLGNENEMAFTLTDGARLLNKDDTYRSLALKAYSDTLNGYVISRSLAAYQRTLLSKGSPYDDYMAGDSTALSISAIRGMNLFYSPKTDCSSCHSGFLFTDQDYHNIGLYQVYKDEGRGRLTLDSTDLGKFKTPSLRNVALTPPYMHDGSLRSLTEVVQFFNTGGNDHLNKDSRIKPLQLSKQETADLVAFLEALTDKEMP